MLMVDPNSRHTAETGLAHRWFTSGAPLLGGINEEAIGTLYEETRFSLAQSSRRLSQRFSALPFDLSTEALREQHAAELFGGGARMSSRDIPLQPSQRSDWWTRNTEDLRDFLSRG